MVVNKGPIPSFYGCYLLRSIPSPSRFYIGSTPDPLRRLKQHNGEIKGGARKTSKSGPWDMIALVGGFPSARHALRFEWAWQNPEQTTAVSKERREEHEAVAQHRSRSGNTKRPSQTFSKSLARRFSNLILLLSADSFARWPLELHIFDSDVLIAWEEISSRYADHHKYPPVEVIFEPSVREKLRENGSMVSTTGRPNSRGHDVLKNIDTNYTTLQEYITKSLSMLTCESPLLCSVCLQSLEPSCDSYIVICPHGDCKSSAHMTCLAKHYLKNENKGEQDHGSELCLPVSSKCPACNKPSKWVDIVKEHSVRGTKFKEEDWGKGKEDFTEDSENSSSLRQEQVEADCEGDGNMEDDSESSESSSCSSRSCEGDYQQGDYEEWFWKPEVSEQEEDSQQENVIISS